MEDTHYLFDFMTTLATVIAITSVMLAFFIVGVKTLRMLKRIHTESQGYVMHYDRFGRWHYVKKAHLSANDRYVTKNKVNGDFMLFSVGNGFIHSEESWSSMAKYLKGDK